MSSPKQRGRQRATIIGSIIGFIIIVSFTITLIAPGGGTSTSSDSVYNTPEPTEVILPTPDPDPNLEGAPPFIHSSGLFSTFRPAGTGWFVSESGPDEDSGIVRVVIQNPNQLTVIHNYIQPGVEYETLASLSENYLTRAVFSEARRDYDSWREMNRIVTDDAVIIDFAVASDGLNYTARSINWLSNNRLFATRIVTPSNNPAMLDLLQGYIMAAFKLVPGIHNMPLLWQGFVDQGTGYVLKYPSDWQQVAGGAGRPVTFTAAPDQGEQIIRTWAVPDQPLESQESVSQWIAEAEPTATLLSIVPRQQVTGTGYEVAYTFVDAAGDSRSGLMVLVNDDAGKLFVANLQTDVLGSNLIAAENLPTAVADAVRTVRGGFVVLPEDMRSETG